MRRNLTIVTVEQDEDGYTVTMRYLSARQAARLIRQSRKIQPLPPAAKRALYSLGQLRPRGGRRRRDGGECRRQIDAVLRDMARAEHVPNRGFSPTASRSTRPHSTAT